MKHYDFVKDLLEAMKELSVEELKNTTDDYELYYFPDREVIKNGKIENISAEV